MKKKILIGVISFIGIIVGYVLFNIIDTACSKELEELDID